jgi:NitT/TauT family transport system substrate-binding protein
MFMRKLLRLTVFAAMTGVLALRGHPAAAADTKITFVTDWKAEAEHGGFYEALALGLYKKAGLDVTIRQGGPSIDNMQLLAAGAVDFAIGSNSFGPLNLAQVGAKDVAVMAAFQKDPQCLMTHPRSDIKSLADIKRKPILISSGSVNTFFLWLKAKYGFTDSQIRPYTFNMAPFLVNAKAIQQGYVSSEPFIVQQQGGFTPQVYLFADYGYPSYATLVMVSQKMVENHPEVVQAFVNASIEGWYDYLHGDPSPANMLIKKDDPDETDLLIAYAIRTIKADGLVEGGDAATLGIGAMTDARWKEFFDVMSREGVYPKALDYKSGYTLQFVNKDLSLHLAKP